METPPDGCVDITRRAYHGGFLYAEYALNVHRALNTFSPKLEHLDEFAR